MKIDKGHRGGALREIATEVAGLIAALIVCLIPPLRRRLDGEYP